MGEKWSVFFNCIGRPREGKCVTLNIREEKNTYLNLISFKARMGYSSRDFLYYKKRCGTAAAFLKLIDFEQDAVDMLQHFVEEREIRFVISKYQEEEDIEYEITPMKPRRHSSVSEQDFQMQDLDAYKVWLRELPQDVNNPGNNKNYMSICLLTSLRYCNIYRMVKAGRPSSRYL